MDHESFARPSADARSGGAVTGGVMAPPAVSIPAARTPMGATLDPAQERLAVLVVDGDPGRRETIARALGESGVSSVAVTDSPQEARARARAAVPCDLAVVALDLPGSLELLGDLRAHGWRAVVHGGPADPASAGEAFRAGALAYLLTSSVSGPGEIPAPFLEPGARPVALPTGEGRGVRMPGVDGAPRDLSAREAEVLQHVADGNSNAMIGETLELSALTVKSHLSRIGRKLGTGDRAQMVALAMRAGVVR